jgi:chromosome segregation ATPase
MEAANALYGVTMEEEGVSKLVAVRFNKAAVASAQLVSG